MGHLGLAEVIIGPGSVEQVQRAEDLINASWPSEFEGLFACDDLGAVSSSITPGFQECLVVVFSGRVEPSGSGVSGSK